MIELFLQKVSIWEVSTWELEMLRHGPLAVHYLFAREASRDDVLRKFGAASNDLQTVSAKGKRI